MRFAEIERLRGLAICLAILNHYPLNRVVANGFNGWAGVDLFFVISGFVVSQSLFRLLPEFGPGEKLGRRVARSWPGLRTFFIHRAFRILPMAFVSLALIVALALWFNSSGVWSAPARIGEQVLAVLTLTHNYALQGGMGADMAFFWSLTVEEHFYLSLPVFLLLIPGMNARAAVLFTAIVLMGAVLRPILPRNEAFVDASSLWVRIVPTHQRFDGLAAGVLLAILYGKGLLVAPARSLGVALAGKAGALASIALLCVIPNALPWRVVEKAGLTVIVAASAVLVALASLQRGYVLGAPVVRNVFEYLGSRSYSFYVLHGPVWHFLVELRHRFPWLHQVPLPFAGAVYVAFCIGAADLSFRLIEAPVRDLGRRIAGTKGRAQPVASRPRV